MSVINFDCSKTAKHAMSPKTYLFFADSVLFIHVLVVAFVVLGLVVTLIGGVAKWAWVRNPWFRLTHLV